MANYKVHDNPVRDEWMGTIGQLASLQAAAKALVDFRNDHMTPFRKNYDLELECNWIERKLEEKVALLKDKEITDDSAFLNNTVEGKSAQAVADECVAKMAACTDKMAAEKIHIQFRSANKPPLMPVNVFMDTDRILGTKLMELRNTDYYGESLEELRKRRGITVIVDESGTTH